MSDFWSLADKINTALLLITALSVAAAFWQIRTAAVAQRATFLKDLYIQLKSDEAVAEAFYLIEYSKFTYDSTFHDSPLEKKVDRLLTLIDLVCEMRGQGVISKREMEFFRYQFLRVATDPAIRQYGVSRLVLSERWRGSPGVSSIPSVLARTTEAAAVMPNPLQGLPT